ncbi:inositol-tetrakisphosphate 1-kinase-like isoform X3 [Macrobrachium rosenbergii]|uniref:inositol-tetrakisphosphate 1-kinase-like isoform X3 n=2 Tax=Macrobrachium rosenbergii TaxID=79674 RepID=UPI0034D44422
MEKFAGLKMELSKSPEIVVGYWFNDKKCQKFGVEELEAVCRRRDIKLVKLDMSSPLEDQGPFHMILHKVTALYAQALSDDPKAVSAVKMLENYTANHPEVYIIDPLPGVRKLLLRQETYELLQHILKDEKEVFTPRFVLLPTSDLKANEVLLKEANVTFPVVCKPLTAGGGKEAHEMDVVFNQNGISDCAVPCVAQSFINHGAVLYKLFVLGPVWFVVVRPSLKNFYAGERETVHFNSHHVSKADSQSPLNQLDPVDKAEDLPKADPAVFNRIVSLVREALNMDLLGIDVVVESSTGKYGIIDVNAFPSYDSVPSVMEHLVDLLVFRMNRCSVVKNSEGHSHPLIFASPDQPQEDSGVDTG